jgi:hypothetical protein
MTHVITFSSTTFDVTKETPNPINPIAGESVLHWLREKLIDSPYKATAPATEDWGWYVYVNGAGASYLVGASADAGEPSRTVDWTVQIHKQRSLKDKITGADKMTIDDQLSALIERIIRAHTDVTGIDIDRGA